MPIVMKVTKRYPVPPVLSVHWTPADWERTAFYTHELPEQQFFGDTWHAADRDASGNILYQRFPKKNLT